ncbi:hypothetical protein ACRALDRAFT_2020410 [Sodiomyces alcalophilus JCM 7366]|uniref:uncharacterized protein n=1 Tax=Sodiomyces alcalophilus JCM 7366 TaxID=591952 RepID=UPI0039B6C172
MTQTTARDTQQQVIQTVEHSQQLRVPIGQDTHTIFYIITVIGVHAQSRCYCDSNGDPLRPSRLPGSCFIDKTRLIKPPRHTTLFPKKVKQDNLASIIPDVRKDKREKNWPFGGKTTTEAADLPPINLWDPTKDDDTRFFIVAQKTWITGSSIQLLSGNSSSITANSLRAKGDFRVREARIHLDQ